MRQEFLTAHRPCSKMPMESPMAKSPMAKTPTTEKRNALTLLR